MRCNYPSPVHCFTLLRTSGPPESPWHESRPPSANPAQMKASLKMVSLRLLDSNHSWHFFWLITSTSTSCSLSGVSLWPCAVLPQPITVALSPTYFDAAGGRQTWIRLDFIKDCILCVSSGSFNKILNVSCLTRVLRHQKMKWKCLLFTNKLVSRDPSVSKERNGVLHIYQTFQEKWNTLKVLVESWVS